MTDGLLERLVAPLRRDPDVRGVLLTGSRARGDALPRADIDLLVLVALPPKKTFVSETFDGTLAECYIRDLEGAEVCLLERPLELYGYLDGKVLYDPDGSLAELTEAAKDCFARYRASFKEKQAIFYWLKSTRLKLRVALNAGDSLKLGYHSSVNSWKVLEGLWAINDKPMPPAGAVWAHLPDLRNAPTGLVGSLQRLFEGSTVERAQTMLALIDWLLEREEKP